VTPAANGLQQGLCGLEMSTCCCPEQWCEILLLAKGQPAYNGAALQFLLAE